MLSSRTTARARNPGGGGNVRSSRRRSENSARELGSAMRRRIRREPSGRKDRGAGLAAQRDQPGADLRGDAAVGHRAEAEKRAVVLDRRGHVAVLVRKDGEVVMRSGIPRIERNGAPQQI